MALYKVGTYLNAEVTATEYVEADYFTEALGEGLNFYQRGEGEGKERKDTRVGAWMKGTYSFVREVWEPPIAPETEGKEETPDVG